MKNICIIGASSGLGLRCTVDYLKEGHRVFGTCFKDARALVGLKTQFNGLIFTHYSLGDELPEYPFDSCDTLILSAGQIYSQLLIKEPLETFQHQLDINLSAPFQLCQQMYCPLKKSPNPHIILITSGSALYGNTGQAAYSAAKAGLSGLMKSLAREWGQTNIKINMISPGYLRSRQTLAADKGLFKKYKFLNVLKRTNTLQEVSAFIRHLASTRNISGQQFQLDSRLN